jgi:hypothetical protein
MPEAVVIDIVSPILNRGLLELMKCKDRQIEVAYLKQNSNIEGDRRQQKIQKNPAPCQSIIDYIEELHPFICMHQNRGGRSGCNKPWIQGTWRRHEKDKVMGRCCN